MHENSVYLVQTDTTVGFLSLDDKKLANIKQRPYSKKTLQVVDSFATLKQNTRIPQNFKKMVRRSKNSTFIYPNGQAFRVVDKNDPHHDFVKRFQKIYSTSANMTQKEFCLDFAVENSDVIVEDHRGFSQNKSSKIIRINNKKAKIIR